MNACLGTKIDAVDVRDLYPWWDIKNTSVEQSHLGLTQAWVYLFIMGKIYGLPLLCSSTVYWFCLGKS